MRINVIPVKYLADAHLRAEFREIPLSIHYYKRSIRAGLDKGRISPVYTLNKGHGYMWYDKFGYIRRRYEDLLTEMQIRGFRTTAIEEKFYKLFIEYVPDSAQGEYTPTPKDLQINLDRILIRIKSKEGQNFYKYCGQDLTYNQWEEIYSTMI